jgi:hypothetical protein
MICKDELKLVYQAILHNQKKENKKSFLFFKGSSIFVSKVGIEST